MSCAQTPETQNNKAEIIKKHTKYLELNPMLKSSLHFIAIFLFLFSYKAYRM